jgi:hypothetical protein
MEKELAPLFDFCGPASHCLRSVNFIAQTCLRNKLIMFYIDGERRYSIPSPLMQLHDYIPKTVVSTEWVGCLHPELKRNPNVVAIVEDRYAGFFGVAHPQLGALTVASGIIPSADFNTVGVTVRHGCEGHRRDAPWF